MRQCLAPRQENGFFDAFWTGFKRRKVSDLLSAVQEEGVITQLPVKRLEQRVVAKHNCIFHLCVKDAVFAFYLLTVKPPTNNLSDLV